MSVGISYTGVDGRTTKFSSSSPSMAIERLSRIPGYAGGEADQIAAALAPGWRERHKARAAQFANRHHFVGRPSGEKFVSQSGVVSGIDSSSVAVEDGKLIARTQRKFVSEGGQVVGVGPLRTESLPVASSAESVLGKSKENETPPRIVGSVEVSLGTVYNPKTHVLSDRIGEISVKNGRLVATETGLRKITEAVPETV